MLPRAIFLATVLLLSAAASGLYAQGIQPNASATYQPPLIPVTISIDSNGKLSVRAAASCVTPIGTFGVGGGVKETTPSTGTFFIVRQKNKESVYCIGRGGKLRISTDGKSVVDISSIRDRSNAFLLDVRDQTGEFKIEFIPDSNAKDLARVRQSAFDHVVLSTKGELVIDQTKDKVIPLAQIRKVYVAKTPTGLSWLMWFYNEDGRKKYGGLSVQRNEEIEALWLCHCLSSIDPTKVEDVTIVETFGKHRGCVYSDGSVLLNIAFIPGEHIDKVVTNHTIPSKVDVLLNRIYRTVPGDKLSLTFPSADLAVRFADLAESERSKARAK